MVLAVFAMGYNLLYGYVGLLSLGHAMFFSAGLYGAGLSDAASRLGRAGGLRRRRRGRRAAGAGDRRAGAADHRRRLHDRHHDVRAGVLPDDALLQRLDARRRGFRAAAADARHLARRSAARPQRSGDALLGGARPVLDRARHHGGDRPLAPWPRAGGDPRERRAHADARLRHFPQQARRRRRLRRHLRGRGRRLCRAVRLCRLDLRLGAVFDPAAAVGAARRRGDDARARSSARCSCTTWSTSPAATPRPIC